MDDPNYYGLAPDKEVGLLGAGVNITCTRVERDEVHAAAQAKLEELRVAVRVGRRVGLPFWGLG